MAALEFSLPPDDIARLLRMPVFGRRPRRPSAADRVWHDTPGGALIAEGLSVCEQRGRWRLEGAHPVPGQLWAPGTPAPLFGEAASCEQLAEAAGRTLPTPLMPLAGFRGRQRTVAIEGDSEPATLLILDGALRGVTREREVCRVVMQGSAPRLLTLSSDLSQAVRLSVPRCSLASEALALARGQSPEMRHTGAPQVAPGTSLADAVAIVLGHLADVILAGSLTAGDGHSPEPVHQMRVAVRRLRSALSVFRRAVPAATFDAVKTGLQRLATVLGGARDWDVFLAGAGAAVGAALPDDPRIAAMLAEGGRRRARAYAEVRALLAAPESRHLEVALVQLAALRIWEPAADADQAEQLQADAALYAGRVLERRLDHMLSPGADISQLPVEDLHTLRKEGKRLRYACEFFAPLYGRRAPRRFIERLSVLQEALGHLNDTASAAALMGSLGRSADRQFAAGVVQGFVAARAGDTRRDIEHAWDRFRRQEPFWT